MSESRRGSLTEKCTSRCAALESSFQFWHWHILQIKIFPAKVLHTLQAKAITNSNYLPKIIFYVLFFSHPTDLTAIFFVPFQTIFSATHLANLCQLFCQTLLAASLIFLSPFYQKWASSLLARYKARLCKHNDRSFAYEQSEAAAAAARRRLLHFTSSGSQLSDSLKRRSQRQ